MNITVIRIEKKDTHTIGALTIDGEAFCWTMERPWMDNKKGESCIPTGEYVGEITVSQKFGRSLWLRNVPGRTEILFHAGNVATDSRGCILLGNKLGMIGGVRAVLDSRSAVAAFMDRLTASGEVLFDVEVV